MLLRGGKKPEYPEETHASLGSNLRLFPTARKKQTNKKHATTTHTQRSENVVPCDQLASRIYSCLSISQETLRMHHDPGAYCGPPQHPEELGN